MKIYEAEYGSMVTVVDENVKIPPEAEQVAKCDQLKVLQNDGMYRHCINKDGEDVYVAGWTEVTI